jgi:methylene-tetrahydromethanopterin dehydrogenase
MVGDFQVGLFADPNGAYTTSASVVALVEHALKVRTRTGLSGRRVAVFGTGPVGLCTAVLAAQQQGAVTLCQLTANGQERVARRFGERYGVELAWASAETAQAKREILADTEVALCTARAGVRVLDAELLEAATGLLVAADVNAVPPSGIEGIAADDHLAVLETRHTTVSTFGALAIGRLKYRTQFGLYQTIQTAATPALLDFPQAFACALETLRDPAREARAA